MSELVAIAYPDERQASAVMDAIKRLDEAGTLDLDDAVAVAKDREGRIQVAGATSHMARGAAGGLLLGAVLGMIFVAPVVGALFGAASGALAGSFHDVEQNDFVRQVGDNLKPGSSAILMLVSKADPEKTLAALHQYGGKVMRTTLPDDAEARLRAALGEPAAGAA